MGTNPNLFFKNDDCADCKIPGKHRAERCLLFFFAGLAATNLPKVNYTTDLRPDMGVAPRRSGPLIPQYFVGKLLCFFLFIRMLCNRCIWDAKMGYPSLCAKKNPKKPLKRLLASYSDLTANKRRLGRNQQNLALS